uniref:uncharacterized protein LOC120331373 n=1 Tax=Styela clava TaxID=7725 RepID=UPI00193A290D|nr:uncharacterized protein LOC120331373 [Styela clava]
MGGQQSSTSSSERKKNSKQPSGTDCEHQDQRAVNGLASRVDDESSSSTEVESTTSSLSTTSSTNLQLPNETSPRKNVDDPAETEIDCPKDFDLPKKKETTSKSTDSSVQLLNPDDIKKEQHVSKPVELANTSVSLRNTTCENSSSEIGPARADKGSASPCHQKKTADKPGMASSRYAKYLTSNNTIKGDFSQMCKTISGSNFSPIGVVNEKKVTASPCDNTQYLKVGSGDKSSVDHFATVNIGIGNTTNLQPEKIPSAADISHSETSDKKDDSLNPSVSSKSVCDDAPALLATSAKDENKKAGELSSTKIPNAPPLYHVPSMNNTCPTTNPLTSPVHNEMFDTKIPPPPPLPKKPVQKELHSFLLKKKPCCMGGVKIDNAQKRKPRKDDLETNNANSHHIRRLHNLDDKFLSKSNEKSVYWILGRYLSNEEIASRIIDKYRLYYCTSGECDEMNFDHPQKLISYFLTRSFDNMLPSEVAFLLSEKHRLYKGLQIPNEVKKSKSLQEYIKKHKTYFEIVQVFETAKAKILKRRSQTNLEPVKDEKTEKNDSPKLNFTRVKRDCQLEDQFVFDSRIVDTNSEGEKPKTIKKSFILCGSFTHKLPEDNALTFRAENISDDLDVVKMFEDGLRKKMASGSENNMKVFSMIWESVESEEEDRFARFKSLALFGWHPKYRTQNYATMLDEVLRDKPVGCPTEELISWPWNADCDRLTRKVRCLMRINTTVKRLSSQSATNCPHELARKMKGKRGKRAKWRPPENRNDQTHQDTSQNPSDSCTYQACQIFHDDFIDDNISVVSKSVVVYPIYLTCNGMMVFLSGKSHGGNGKEPNTTSLKIHDILPNLLRCNCPLNFQDRLADCTRMSSKTFSSGEKHHHDDLVVDILLPMYMDDVTNFIMSDLMLVLRLLAHYIADVHKQCFVNVDFGNTIKNVEKHVKDVISLCENVFSFLLFSEIWGPAEEHMRGSYYLTTAYKHYQASRDSAIHAGVYPVFSEFMSNNVFKLPCSLQFVQNSSMYSVALSFLDHRVHLTTPNDSNNDLAGGDSAKEFGIEPMCVGLLESALGKGFFSGVDDDLTYKLITNQAEGRRKLQGLALLSPVYDPKHTVEARLRLLGVNDVRYTNKGLNSMLPSDSEEKMAEIYKDIADAFEQSLKQESKDTEDEKLNAEQDNHNYEKTAFDVMQDIFESLQKSNKSQNDCKDLPKDNDTVMIADCIGHNVSRKIIEEPNEAPDEESKVVQSKSESAQTKPENDPSSSNDTEAAVIEQSENSAETDSKNDSSDSKVVQARGKKSREYLSSAKRQQRQAKRLRQKWEKKHKTESDLTKADVEEQ